jgi:hypothetical protein
LASRRLPLEDRFRGDVPQPPRTEQRADVRLGVLAVVEPGLHGQPLVGVEPVEIQVEQLVERHPYGRRARHPAVAAQQLLAGMRSLGGGAKAALGDLRALAGQRVAAERGLEVPPALAVGVDALGSCWHGPAPSVRTTLRAASEAGDEALVLTAAVPGTIHRHENALTWTYSARSEGLEPPTF